MNDEILDVSQLLGECAWAASPKSTPMATDTYTPQPFILYISA